MELSIWLLFAFAITAASLSPGPNVLIVVLNTLRYGSRGAVFTIMGNLVCLFLVALLASVGVGAAIATAPLAFQIMKIAGGLYLAWIGYKIIRSSFGPQQELDVSGAEKTVQEVSGMRLFGEAFLVSASNPKSILFLTAIFPQFLDVSAPLTVQFPIMFVTIIGLVSVIHGTYAYLAISLRQRSISQRFRRWVARLTGTTFIGLGAGVALAK
jgi:homoserine/homoserine lactone efflux protein